MDEPRSHDMTAAEFTLSSECDTGLWRLFGSDPGREVLERLGHELDLIRRKGLARRFLSVASVVDSVKKSGSLVGPGRGASASSLVCYLLGITGIDPMKYDLVFERLLPSSGGTLDIYIDIEEARRDGIVSSLGSTRSSESIDSVRVGAVEVDLLGLRALDRIAGTIQLAEAAGQLVDLSLVPLDDGPVFDVLRSASTRDIFQLGSLGMRRALRDLQPTTLDDLIALIALYRPSAMLSLGEYIRRSHGTQRPALDPLVDEILDSTHGLIVYQEQVMQVAIRFSGFTGVQANGLRRDLGFRDPQRLEEGRSAFLGGALARGHEAVAAVRVWDALAQAADRAFCKSHAVAYALLTYWDAYLAAHYPEAHATAAGMFALPSDPSSPGRMRSEEWTAVDISVGSLELARLIPPPRACEIVLIAGHSGEATAEYACAIAARAALSGAQVVLRSFSPFVEEVRDRLAGISAITISTGAAGVAGWSGDEDFDTGRPRLLILDRIDLDETMLDAGNLSAADQLGRAVSLVAGIGECVVVATAVIAELPDEAGRARTVSELGPLAAAEPYCDGIAFVERSGAGTGSHLRLEVLKSRWGSCGEVVVTMFSESELREIDDAVGGFCRRESQPDDAHWRRMGYEAVEGGVTLFWEELGREHPGGRRRDPVAHFAFDRARDEWVLWWMSDDICCLYPGPEQADLASLVAVVEDDEFGAFSK